MNIVLVVIELAGLLLVLLAQTAGVVGWYLRRERDHERADEQKHLDIAKEFTKVRSDHSSLAGDVQALESRVDGMPSRDLMEEHMRRLRDEIRGDLKPLQAQMAQLIELQIKSATSRNRRVTDDDG